MRTERFSEILTDPKPIIAMIHVQALPGTPAHHLALTEIVEQAVSEAKVLDKASVQAIMLENMHDRPYLNRAVGPEIIAGMTRVASEVRRHTDLPLGIQILAGANQAAMAVAQAAELQFIRAEGFVFGHVADEGLIQSDAGALLRYRKLIGADDILIFTDIKKKHSSHALTGDISLVDTAEAADFFLSDGNIITGEHTGKPVSSEELKLVQAQSMLPVLVGSGVTPEGLPEIWKAADAFIVGSYLKQDGHWDQALDQQRIDELLQTRKRLLSS